MNSKRKHGMHSRRKGGSLVIRHDLGRPP
jgi:hypothetical protein